MTWDAYRYFLAVAKERSFSAAARDLGVTQPTVGRQIRELESQLDARLFERLAHGLALTPSGEAILGLAEEIESSVHGIERRICGEDARLTGQVCISTANCLGIYWMVPKLPKIRRQCPGIEILLLLAKNALDVMRRECDVAVRLGEPQSEDLVGKPILQVNIGLYASTSYLQVMGEPKSVDDLAHHVLIESIGELSDLPNAELLRDVADSAEVAFASNSMVAQFAAAELGVGLLALPGYCAHASTKLRRVLSQEVNVPVDLWLLTHRELQRSARIRAIFDHLESEIRADADLLSM